jgi:predicted ATP-binding protein involved in virulence
MSRINKITVRNFKAVSEMEMTFNGCTAIITGGNNKGKSTILRGIADRIRGEKPEFIVKEGEHEGVGILELTTGEKFTWQFDIDGKDKLTLITPEGIKGSVTREIAKKYFPEQFDIDKFMISQPKQQAQMLQKLVGLDFTEIDARYKIAFDQRTEANREEYRLRQNLEKIEVKPERVEPVKLDDLVKQKAEIKARLESLYQSNKKHNDQLRNTYNKIIEETRKAVEEFNEEQDNIQFNIDKANDMLKDLIEFGYKGNEVKNGLKHFQNRKHSKHWMMKSNQFLFQNTSHLKSLKNQN